MSKETDELTTPETGNAAVAAGFDPDFNGSASAFRAPAAPRTVHDRRDDFPIIVHCHLRWDFVWQRPQQIFSRLAAHHRILFIEDPVIAEGEPHLAIDEPMSAPGYLGQFGGPGIVYDCMDELANFRFAPPDIADRERFVMSKANVMFTGGHQLFESKSRHHGNVHFYGCGVDVEHYGKARLDETVVPESVASLRKPVFGYFGVIDERLDYELVAALAERFPEASVAMAGPFAKVDRNELPDLPNIHWLGQQKYEDLPSLVKGFDVCLMPFALNEATKYINPTKTLEYMAGAKPVVSTAIADVVRNFTPIVQVARSPEEFVDAVERAWRSPDPALIAEGVERAANATWDATVASMRSDIQEAVFGSVPASTSATSH